MVIDLSESLSRGYVVRGSSHEKVWTGHCSQRYGRLDLVVRDLKEAQVSGRRGEQPVGYVCSSTQQRLDWQTRREMIEGDGP